MKQYPGCVLSGCRRDIRARFQSIGYGFNQKYISARLQLNQRGVLVLQILERTRRLALIAAS